jgi:hypothetical protein
MKAFKYLPILLITGAISSCQQAGTSSTSGLDSTSIDTIVKTDTVIKTDTIVQTDTTDDQPPTLAQLIVPGKSAGQTTLNENTANLIKRMGKPDDGDAAMGKSLSTWYAGHDTSGYQTQVFSSRNMGNEEISRVKQIRVTSPWFKTAHGMHVGTPLKRIYSDFKLTKVATYTDESGTYGIYDDEGAGIAFETDDKDQCSGIIIHEPKTKLGAYLPFHSNIKVLK